MALDQPRTHHYRFAHQRLPQIMLDPGIDVAALAVAGRLDTALRSTWAAAAEGLDEAERLEPDGLAGELHAGDDVDVVLVTLPPALGPAEAHFVALAAAGSTRRFFTLELSVSVFSSEIGTVLGEWTDDRHVNYGSGPAPTAPDFLAAVRGLLAG